jgi:hypothetical protein
MIGEPISLHTYGDSSVVFSSILLHFFFLHSGHRSCVHSALLHCVPFTLYWSYWYLFIIVPMTDFATSGVETLVSTNMRLFYLLGLYFTIYYGTLIYTPKATEMEPGAWGYNWVTLSLGNINTETWSSRLGVGSRLTTSFCKKFLLRNPKDWKPNGLTHDGIGKCSRIF